MDLDDFEIPTGEPVFPEKGRDTPKAVNNPAKDYRPDPNTREPVYITKKGENLDYIAQVTGMSLGELLEANPHLLEMKFRRGTELKLPPADGAA